jgi:hypothetical protein
LTVKKADGVWKLTAPIATDADKEAVETALTKLEELDAIGVAATKPENYDRLEVSDAKAVHVIAKQGDKVLADVLIGTYLSGNTMVREQGAANVATSKGSIKYAFDKDLKEWRDRSIVDVPVDQVQQIAFKNKNGAWAFVKEGTEWKQAPGEKAIPEFEGSKLTSLVSAIAGLRANDFAADGVTAETAGVGAATVTLTAGGDAGVKETLVRIGNKKDSNYYAMREGKAPIYLISEYVGERLIPTADKFAKDPPKPAAAVPPGKMIQVDPERVPGMAEAMKKPHGHP